MENWKKNWKWKVEKLKKISKDLFSFIYFFIFAFHFSKRLKFVLGLPKWEFSTGKKHFTSGVANIGTRGDRVPPLTAKKLSKIGRKRGKIGKKSRKNQDSEKAKIGKVLSLQMPLLTNRAGYVTAFHTIKKSGKMTAPSEIFACYAPGQNRGSLGIKTVKKGAVIGYVDQ